MKIKIYYEDTDGGGVVYHSKYLNFCERARTNMLQERGIWLSDLQESSNIYFIVARSEIDFLKPAVLEDEIEVVSTILHIGKAFFSVKQGIFLLNGRTQKQREGSLLAESTNKIVCVKKIENNTYKPTAIPDFVIKKLS